jgi:hypothetical protein
MVAECNTKMQVVRPIPDELLAIIKGLKSKVDPFIKESSYT